MPDPHSVENYSIGKGILWIAEWVGTVAPTWPSDYREMGNCPSIEVEPALERLAHYSSRSGFRLKDKNPVIQTEYNVNFDSDEIIGVVILWGLAAIFISVYVRHDERWWAIIPGGTLLILGFLVLVEKFRILDNDFSGFIFLFGMSLVFWFLYLIKDEKNKLEWANIVAAILTIFSFFVLSNEWDDKISEILFPISIILCGGYLIVRGFLTDKQQVNKQREN